MRATRRPTVSICQFAHAARRQGVSHPPFRAPHGACRSLKSSHRARHGTGGSLKPPHRVPAEAMPSLKSPHRAPAHTSPTRKPDEIRPATEGTRLLLPSECPSTGGFGLFPAKPLKKPLFSSTTKDVVKATPEASQECSRWSSEQSERTPPDHTPRKPCAPAGPRERSKRLIRPPCLSRTTGTSPSPRPIPSRSFCPSGGRRA